MSSLRRDVLLNTILAISLILLAGVIGGKLASMVRLPSVTGYLLMGITLGPSLLNSIPQEVLYELAFINEVALGVIAFSIGGELTRERLKRMGQNLTRVFLGEAILTFSLVFLISYSISRSLPLSLLLGVLSLATAPGAIIVILKDYEAKGEFPQVLLSLVALDNLFCIISFGLITSILQVLYYEGSSFSFLLIGAILGNIILSFGVGIICGYSLIILSRYSLPKNKQLVILLGVILLGVGIGIAFHLSSLLITMVIGFMVINYATRPSSFFYLLNTIDTPILVAFLTLAGLKLDIRVLGQVGLLGLGYILARLVGKILGAHIGALFCTQMPDSFKYNIGLALTPQAGVAIGLSVLAQQKLPLPEGLIVSLILSTVIIFELIGPLLLKKALLASGSIEEDVIHTNYS